MRRRAGFALAPLVLQLAACAGARAPAAAARVPVAESVPSPIAGIAFAPAEAEPGELRWSGRANYHEVATFIEALPRRFPAGARGLRERALGERRLLLGAAPPGRAGRAARSVRPRVPDGAPAAHRGLRRVALAVLPLAGSWQALSESRLERSSSDARDFAEA